MSTQITTVLSTFPKLYDELTETDPELMITSKQVFRFVEPSMYNSSLPVDHLLKILLDTYHEYKSEVVKILRICLGKFAKGFDKQKGAIFGFGTHDATHDTGSILNICNFEDIAELQNVPVHNLGEERNVGLFTYEIDFRGRHNFKTASQNIVQNKVKDLIDLKYK